MTHLLVVILHDLSRMPALLEGWKRIGVPGATILRSVGGYQAENWLGKIGLGGLGRMLDQDELRQKTLISVISDDALLEQAIAEADEIVDGFDRPHSGILFTVPVERTLGIRKRGLPGYSADQAQTPGTGPVLNENATIAELLNVLKLEPITVQRKAELPEIVKAMLAHPSVQVICVVNDEQRLVGLVDLASVANAFFVSVFPNEFLSDIQDLEQALLLAKHTQANKAEDIMLEPVWVKQKDSLETSYHLMHKHKLSGIPVVDDHYHIVGYINLLEMMSACLVS